MDIDKFFQIYNDKNLYRFKKMKYKYGKDFEYFLKVLTDYYYEKLPLKDEKGNPLVLLDFRIKVPQNAKKQLIRSRDEKYGLKNVEEEMIFTGAIENIDYLRDSVGNILKGYAPKDDQENRIAGLKKGFDFISENNEITEENIYKLYSMTVGDYLPEEEKPKNLGFYRDDSVYVVSDHIEHIGMKVQSISSSMKALMDFIHAEDDIDDLVKASVIHFYFSFIHPYFDGNGRMARLLHLWFLIQKGYQSTLFMPFSSKIEKTREKYYESYTIIEENLKNTGVLDLTPFVLYFMENVYGPITEDVVSDDVFERYDNAALEGKITDKEKQLWKFVLSYYGINEFSTKQLEKDFGNAAYATIRGFVLKFEGLGLLCSKNYGARIKYKVINN